MRFLLMVFVVLLTACGSSSDDKKSSETLYLNGFWSGNFGSTEINFKMLVLENEVYAFDEERGYYGTATYNQNTQKAELTLTSYMLEQVVEGSKIASGERSSYRLSAFYYHADVPPQLVGDYHGHESNNFELTHEFGWDSSADLSRLTGVWSSPVYKLFINPEQGRKLQFQGISANTEGDNQGCSFKGNLTLINQSTPLYRLQLDERKNCEGFNTSAEGYAAINQDGELEFYLRANNQLMLVVFSESVSSGGSSGPGDDLVDDEDDELDPDDQAPQEPQPDE